tara:strand:+ start:1737 stop:2381 length:645 start_codon:yes stop_codon:yes gene_type:complete
MIETLTPTEYRTKLRSLIGTKEDGDPVIEIWDNALSEKLAKDIHDLMRMQHWKYGHKSDKTIGTQRYWHMDICESPEDLPKVAGPALTQLWQVIQSRYLAPLSISKFHRVYANAHTYGCHGEVHIDDGDYTVMYYPNLNWDPLHFGGTQFWDNDIKNVIKTATYVGNRLICFSGNVPHNAMEVHRACQELRYIIVFKCNADGNFRRLGYYDGKV